MHGQPGHNTLPHARLPPSYPGTAWLTLQLNVTLIRMQRGSFVCLAYFLTYHVWVYVQPDTDRRPVDWCSNYMSVLYEVAEKEDVHKL